MEYAFAVELLPIDSLTANDLNANVGDIGAIATAIAVDGWHSQVSCQDTPDGPRIFAGEHRWRALRMLQEQGIDLPDGHRSYADLLADPSLLLPPLGKIPVQVLAMDDVRALRKLVADNRASALAHPDEARLIAVLEELAADGNLLGSLFDGDDLDELIADLAALNAGPKGSDEVPDVPKVPVTQPGDLWVLGEHRLLCGDATSAADMLILMDGALASLLVTDPPYGVSYAEKNSYLNAIGRPNSVEVPIEGDHQTPEQMSVLWHDAFKAAHDVMQPGAAYYVTGPQGGDLLLLLLALRESGFPLRHMLIWAKNQFVIGRSDYNYQHEPIIHGWVEGAAHHFDGGNGETSLWQIDKPHESKVHPTMKPVELFARAIRNSTKGAGLVLDPFCGSGTTIVACEQEGRKARCVEIDPGYVDVAIARWEAQTGGKAERQ